MTPATARATLTAELAALTARITLAGLDVPDAHGGGGNYSDIDADAAGASQDRESAVAGLARLRLRERAVRDALERVAAGKWGRCRDCRRPIAEARLVAMPTAVCCLACASVAERRDSER